MFLINIMVGDMEGAAMDVSIVALVMSVIYSITIDKCIQFYTTMHIYIHASYMPLSLLVL